MDINCFINIDYYYWRIKEVTRPVTGWFICQAWRRFCGFKGWDSRWAEISTVISRIKIITIIIKYCVLGIGFISCSKNLVIQSSNYCLQNIDILRHYSSSIHVFTNTCQSMTSWNERVASDQGTFHPEEGFWRWISFRSTSLFVTLLLSKLILLF